jgi:hypothetical protein
MRPTGESTFVEKWRIAWQSPSYRKNLLLGLLGLVILFSLFPLFFQSIEKRHGILLHDWVLARIPARDVSLPILILIWATAALMLIRCIQRPDIFLTILWSYFLLCISRVITISLVPLEPPFGLLALNDRLANAFYGPTFITRDLFYSGHTASVFLMYLCLRKKTDRWFTLLSAIIVAVLLLVQHVHYTVDVIAAPFFTYAMYLIALRIVRQPLGNLNASPN